MTERGVRERRGLRGFGPLGLLAILVILSGNLAAPPLSAILVLVWARMSRTPWSSLGFIVPRSWPFTLAAGALFGCVLKLVMKALVMPLFGADPVNWRYHFIAGNPAVLPWMLYVVVVVAGFGEETVFRGYFFERLGALLGSSRAALVSTVVFSTTVFALAHYSDQGATGVEQAAIVGLVFGAIFAKWRQIWFLMAAHAAFDLTAVLLIYWNLEVSVAHLVFQ